MNELASLLPIVPYVVTVALLAVLLRRLAEWNDGPSLASLVGGNPDLLWPRGVQEEEPIRWRVKALRPWRAQWQAPAATLAAGASASPASSRPMSRVTVPHGSPCDSPAPYPPASAEAC
jgi:hypothetical protein